MQHQSVPDLAARARHHVQQARGHPRLLEKLSQDEGGGRGVGGGLQHHGVARGDGGQDAAQGQDEGHVPGGDDGDDPAGLAEDVIHLARIVRRLDLPVQQIGEGHIVAAEIHALPHLIGPLGGGAARLPQQTFVQEGAAGVHHMP